MNFRRQAKLILPVVASTALVLSSLIPLGCSSEVATTPSGKEAARTVPAQDESQSERSKGSSKAVEKLKSIKDRVLGPAGAR